MAGNENSNCLGIDVVRNQPFTFRVLLTAAANKLTVGRTINLKATLPGGMNSAS
jgi:hypothetical protein